MESGVAAASQEVGGLLRFDFFLHSWCTYKCFLKVLSNVPLTTSGCIGRYCRIRGGWSGGRRQVGFRGNPQLPTQRITSPCHFASYTMYRLYVHTQHTHSLPLYGWNPSIPPHPSHPSTLWNPVYALNQHLPIAHSWNSPHCNASPLAHTHALVSGLMCTHRLYTLTPTLALTLKL